MSALDLCKQDWPAKLIVRDQIDFSRQRHMRRHPYSLTRLLGSLLTMPDIQVEANCEKFANMLIGPKR